MGTRESPLGTQKPEEALAREFKWKQLKQFVISRNDVKPLNLVTSLKPKQNFNIEVCRAEVPNFFS